MSYFEFPHTRNYDGDLGYIIKKLDELNARYNNFFEYNSIRFHDPIIWNIETAYIAFEIVYDEQSEAFYISKTAVPSGIDISNTEYWQFVTPFKTDVEFDISSLNPLANKPITTKFGKIDNDIREINSSISETNIKLDNEINTREGDTSSLSNRITSNANAISDETSARTQSDILINARIDEIIDGASVDPDAELLDIRVGANGVTYSTAGNAVRDQFTELQKELNDVYRSAYKTITSAGAYSLAFSVLNGKNYLVTKTGSGNVTINFSSDGSANDQDLGTLTNSAPSKIVTANDDYPYIRGYSAMSSGEVKIIDLQSAFYSTLDRANFANDSINAETIFNDHFSGIMFKSFYVAGGSAHSSTITADMLNINMKQGDTALIYIHSQAGLSRSAQVVSYDENDNTYANYCYYEAHDGAQGTGTITTGRTFYIRELNFDTVKIGLYLPANASDDYITLVVRVFKNDYTFEYVDYMINSANTTIKALQNSKSVSLAFITDIHVNGSTYADNTQFATRDAVKIMNEINKVNPLDVCVFGGDYINNPNTATKLELTSRYACLANTVQMVNTPKFMVKGNHDRNDINTFDTDTAFTDEEVYKYILKYSSPDNLNMEYGNVVNDYGYYDIPNRKIRVIYINTVDVNEGEKEQYISRVSNKQLEFIANALKFDSDNWGVVFFSHHLLQDNETINPSRSSDNYLTPENGGTALLGIINAFINKTTYTYTASGYDISVDYSDNNSNEVIAMIAGHTHRDAIAQVNGYVMLTTTASSFVYTGYDGTGTAITRTLGKPSEMSFDVITIDRINKYVYATRVGAGSDRSSAYGS